MLIRKLTTGISKLPNAVNSQISKGLDGSKLLYKFSNPCQNILITKKQNDSVISKAENELIQYLSTKYPKINIIVSGKVETSYEKSRNVHLLSKQEENSLDLSKVVDLIVTLGGDGTVIRTASMFKTRVPPMVSFAMGSLGFLLPFRIKFN